MDQNRKCEKKHLNFVYDRDFKVSKILIYDNTF